MIAKSRFLFVIKKTRIGFLGCVQNKILISFPFLQNVDFGVKGTSCNPTCTSPVETVMQEMNLTRSKLSNASVNQFVEKNTYLHVNSILINEVSHLIKALTINLRLFINRGCVRVISFLVIHKPVSVKFAINVMKTIPFFFVWHILFSSFRGAYYWSFTEEFFSVTADKSKRRW